MKDRNKRRSALRAAAGVLLCAVGFSLARSSPFRETTVVVNADGCGMVTDIVDTGNDATNGSVVLLHGLAANRVIMTYLARGFALLNLRVFVPDMPGHGRTPGPFSFARADACANSFVRQLIARGAIDPERTILAGHSMGGALAVRVAARIPVAGLVAISPAPMVATYGIQATMLIFDDPPPPPANTLVLSGSWEPRSVRDTAHALVSGNAEATDKYLVIPHSTHASLLLDPKVARASQAWAAHVLNIDSNAALPSRLPIAGSMMGLLGIFLLAGPFLRETLGSNSVESGTTGKAETDAKTDQGPTECAPAINARSASRMLLEIAAASSVIVGLLQAWNPFGVLHVFEGDYLAGFLLILGVVLLALHWRGLGGLWQVKPRPLLAAAFAGIVLPLLIYSWLDLTISEAWLTSARWLRLPALIALMLPYHTAEELLLGPLQARSNTVRLGLALCFRLIAWCALLAGILLMHNGEILLALLAPYFGVFCLLQRTGMDVVRKGTGSPLAAALFGAILLAGFCVVVFPIT
jgi:pimeloyl-ACP methyl ester carboxylesterase